MEGQDHPRPGAGDGPGFIRARPLQGFQLAGAPRKVRGKQADRLPPLDERGDVRHRRLVVLAGNGDGADEVEKLPQPPLPRARLVQHEAQGARGGDLREGPVQPGAGIAHHQDPPGFGDVPESRHFQLAPPPRADGDDEPHQGLGQLEDRVGGARQSHDRQQGKQQMAYLHQGERHRQGEKAQHHRVLNQVVARQHPPQDVFAGVVLDQGVEGNDEHAPQHAQQENVDPMGQRAVQSRQNEQADGDPYGANGDQARFYVVF